MMEIRTAIQIIESHERLNEMPLLVEPNDFGMDDPETNREEYERLIRSPYHEIETRGSLTLAISEHDGIGEYFMFDETKKRILYYVEYTVQDYPKLGQAATQVILWRKAGAGFPGITTRVFGMLLKRYGSMVTDFNQTGDGRRFWIDRMGEAAHAGMTVGMLSENGDYLVYDGEQSLRDWLAGADGWGDEDIHQERSFFITTKKLAQ